MRLFLTYLSLFTLFAVIGCKPAANQTASFSETDNDTGSDSPIFIDEMPPMMEDIHDHPEHGPHGGELVELGKEAFHLELVHGDGNVVMYVLDGSVKKQVPITSDHLLVSLKYDDQIASFDLAAHPDANDSTNKASRFASSDPQLIQWMDEGAEGVVVVPINGKSYTGKIMHDHDGHDHDGHDH